MKPLNVIKERKDQLFRNLVLVSLLSIGISLLANFFSNKYNTNNILFWIGVTLVIVVIVVYLVSFYKSKEYVIKEDSLFITDNEGNFVPIERFDVSRDMKNALVSVFKENGTCKTKWLDSFKKRKINVKDNVEKEESLFFTFNKDKIKYVGELVEYVFLHWLSLKTSSYFDNKKYEIDLLTREKISNYLLQNRFLEMISKPYEEREAFANHSPNKKWGKVCAIFTNDVIYDLFELKLPKGTKLYKEKNVLVIKNRIYSIYFNHGFGGFATNLPTSFAKYYLNRNFDDISVHSFHPEIKIKLNPFFFLLYKNWKVFSWIDIISEEFSEYFSFDKFVDKIGYEDALTNIIINNCSQRRIDERKEIRGELCNVTETSPKDHRTHKEGS